MTAKEREQAEQAWYDARMSWVRTQVEGGVWRCPLCKDVLRLTAEEESRKVNVRCCGMGNGGPEGQTPKSSVEKSHWPVLMERVADIVLGDEDCGKMEGRRNR